MPAGADMNVTKYLGFITLLFLAFMLIASGFALYTARINWSEFLALWGAPLGMVIAYWFKGREVV